MKIYTKTGDKGMTSTYDGVRLEKSAINFALLGEMDELSSRIGMLVVLIQNNGHKDTHSACDFLRTIQSTLQFLNSYVATTSLNCRKRLPQIPENIVSELETHIDNMEKVNRRLTKFILPGVDADDAQAHLCRTQTRKVERLTVEISEKIEPVIEPITEHQEMGDILSTSIHSLIPDIMSAYINRLSDYFFVLARWLTVLKNKSDFFCTITNSK